MFTPAQWEHYKKIKLHEAYKKHVQVGSYRNSECSECHVLLNNGEMARPSKASTYSSSYYFKHGTVGKLLDNNKAKEAEVVIYYYLANGKYDYFNCDATTVRNCWHDAILDKFCACTLSVLEMSLHPTFMTDNRLKQRPWSLAANDMKLLIGKRTEFKDSLEKAGRLEEVLKNMDTIIARNPATVISKGATGDAISAAMNSMSKKDLRKFFLESNSSVPEDKYEKVFKAIEDVEDDAFQFLKSYTYQAGVEKYIAKNGINKTLLHELAPSYGLHNLPGAVDTLCDKLVSTISRLSGCGDKLPDSDKERLMDAVLSRSADEACNTILNLEYEGSPEFKERALAALPPYVLAQFCVKYSFGGHDGYRKKLCTISDAAYKLATVEGPHDETRKAACREPKSALLYAVNVDKARRDDTYEAASYNTEAKEAYDKSLPIVSKDSVAK